MWRDGRRLVFKEAATHRLMEAEISDLQTVQSGIVSCKYVQVPPEMVNEKVAHCWIHYTTGRMAILWQDGRFTTARKPDTVNKPLVADLDWTVIKPAFDDVYLLAAMDKTFKRIEVVMFDGGCGKVAGRQSIQLPYSDRGFIIDKMVEARRSATRVSMVMISGIHYIHVIECSRDAIRVVKSNVNMPGGCTEVCLVDGRSNQVTDMIFGCYQTINRLRINFKL